MKKTHNERETYRITASLPSLSSDRENGQSIGITENGQVEKREGERGDTDRPPSISFPSIYTYNIYGRRERDRDRERDR